MSAAKPVLLAFLAGAPSMAVPAEACCAPSGCCIESTCCGGPECCVPPEPRSDAEARAGDSSPAAEAPLGGLLPEPVAADVRAPRVHPILDPLPLYLRLRVLLI